MIHHHLDDALLLEYTSGAANPPRALVAASHLTLCPACRARQASYDAVGGALLDRADPIAADGLLAATMSRLDEPDTLAPGGLATDPDGVLPGPVAAIVGRYSTLPWRRTFPFVEEVTVDQGFAGFPARLFRLTPGTFVPRHQHAGDELSLVLAGGFSDDRGHHGRGDLSVRAPDELHRQSIDWGEPCVVLVAADAPFRPRSVVARLASWFGKF